MDLRCYGLTTPRHDGKLSVHFADIDNFYHEWNLSDLPWDAVTPVKLGGVHPDNLDEKLVNAITGKALGPVVQPKAKAAAIAFLYLYMILAHGGERYVSFVFDICAISSGITGHRSTSPLARHYQSALASARPRHSLPVPPPLYYSSTSAYQSPLSLSRLVSPPKGIPDTSTCPTKAGGLSPRALPTK